VASATGPEQRTNGGERFMKRNKWYRMSWMLLSLLMIMSTLMPAFSVRAEEYDVSDETSAQEAVLSEEETDTLNDEFDGASEVWVTDHHGKVVKLDSENNMTRYNTTVKNAVSTWHTMVYEPSKDVDGNLQYIAGKEVLRNISNYSWERKFQNYSPENGSQMSSITTYYLLLLRFLKDGFATIEQLADDSKEIGHYYDSIDAKHEYEKTGERQLGGIYGFGGNTFKVVKDPESPSGFSILGGDCYNYGCKYPLADGEEDDYPYDIKSDRIGLLELIK